MSDKHNKAVQGLTRFINLFGSAVQLRDAFSAVPKLEGEIAGLRAEKKKAENDTAKAMRDRDAAEHDLKLYQSDCEKALAHHKAELKAEADALILFKQKCVQETKAIRVDHDAQRKRIIDETLALEAKRSNLAKDVRELDEKKKPTGNPPESRQARIER